jgi:hypothetical protein
VLGAAAFELDAEWFEQVVGRVVLAMLFLDALEEGELAARPHVELEVADAVDEVIVDALAVTAVGLTARLPVPFEHAAGIVGERGELRRSWTREEQARQGEYTGKDPG